MKVDGAQWRTLALDVINLRVLLLDRSLGIAEVKLFPCLINHYTKMCGGVEVYLHIFLDVGVRRR
jgi:hypothetical protein